MNISPPEFLYLLGLSLKKHYMLRHQKRLSHKVFSIGNITLGGTGKTPATIALAREAMKRGFMPCILTRGYKGKAEGPCFVSRGEGALLNEYQAGDEAVLIAQNLPGVVIVKGKDRYEAGMFALQNLQLQISDSKSRILFILDDGYQHWKLFRDKDILLIDGTKPFGNRRLLPLGSLREPLKAMERADIIVITKAADRQKPAVLSLINEIKKYNTKAPVFFASHKPSAFIASSGETLSLKWAEDKKFFSFCGIGNPHALKETLVSAGVHVTGSLTFRDHYRYSIGDLKEIMRNAERSGAEYIITTEKDIMRLRGFELPRNLVALKIEFFIDDDYYNVVFD
jgi:tetraacyldisaccharide 4'-kinase